MRFTSLELVGFKRMQLNDVERFVIRPTEIIQLILGTNGSGKSSLIRELTPLPADPKAFDKEGSKTITISHRGHQYKLVSKFSPKAEHHFYKDDENLNPGGTGSVQKELVRQEFGITGEIHELLIGEKKFCDMSPTERREWFTKLSDIDYDFALSIYNKLKERARDISGALKLAKKRLVVEISKVISPEEQQALSKEVQDLITELDFLQSHRAPVERPSESYQEELTTGLEELARMSNRLLRTRFIAPYGTDPTKPMQRDEWGQLTQPTFHSLEDIDGVIDLCRHDIGVKEVLINKAVEEHGKVQESVDVLVKTGADGIKALLEKQRVLRDTKKDILSKRKLGLEGIEAHNCLSALDSVHELLVSIFAQIPENEDKRFSQLRLQDLQAKLLETKEFRMRVASGITKMNSQREHMEAHRNSAQTECPKCTFRWVVGYSQEKYNELLEMLANKEQELANMDKAIEDMGREIQEIEAYAVLYRDYVRCTRSWPILNPLWDYISNEQVVTRSPRMVLAILETFRHDLGLEADAKVIDREMEDLQDLIRSSEQVGDANLAEEKTKLDRITLSIEELTFELTNLRSKLNDFTHYRRQLAEAQDLGQRITVLHSSLEQMNKDMIEMMRRETLNHCIRQLQHSLARKEETLSAVLLQKGIIVDLEKQIEKLIIEDEAAKALVKQLSPTEGLIAEGLLGFIRNFTGQMNNLIRKIWSYPLMIKDCGVSSESGAELDYKFPLMVQTKDNVVDDVKMGSTGMKEIVNLAFKVVAMRYLHLAESPLYLDEFGASFDEAHRTAASATVKALMEQQPFTQLYMVSHYEAGYGALTQAQICVICPNNITVPKEAKYNQHVTIQ